MDISTVADLIEKVPLSSWIASFALIISIISLYISIRKLNYERKLESARKRTELLNRLSDYKRNLINSLNCCKLARPVSRECKDRWQDHLPKIENEIKRINEIYYKLEKCGYNIDPLKFENITPTIYGLLKDSEVLQSEFKDLREMCLLCPVNKPESCNDPKRDEK
jgi:uncharacterized protein YeeX (DUF496 family)